MSRGKLVVGALCFVAAVVAPAAPSSHLVSVAIILSKSGDLRVKQKTQPPVLESVDPYVLEKRLIGKILFRRNKLLTHNLSGKG
eukprot:751868-Hanusia_phi.AAC.1